MSTNTDSKIGEIDLVYTWVNGNDPQWLEKRNKMLPEELKIPASELKGRYTDNNELLYSLRSVEKYLPWVRKIFIITDNQVPAWLNANHPKIQIVDHKEIMPAEILPCFNSTVIEHFLCDVPGLSECFLFSNDDCLINRPATPADFFTPDGLPIIRVRRRYLRKFWLKLKAVFSNKPATPFNQIIDNSALLVKKKYGKYYQAKAHHNIDAYRKSDFIRIREIFINDLQPSFIHHFRESSDMQRMLYYYAALAEGRGTMRYVDDSESLRVSINKDRYYRQFAKTNPLLFCMNDSGKATDDDREKAKSFLAARFPEKSQFEL